MDPQDSSAISNGVSVSELSSEPAWTDDGQQTTKARGQSRKPHDSGKRGAWLTNRVQKMTNWLGTSEPSVQALIQHRKETFERAGVSQKDVDAHSKLHAPIGEIPPDAVRPATGPSPEELVRKKAAKRRKHKLTHHSSGAGGGSLAQPSSSGSSIYSGGQDSTMSSFTTFPYTGSSH
jgi:hypothetical protein